MENEHFKNLIETVKGMYPEAVDPHARRLRVAKVAGIIKTLGKHITATPKTIEKLKKRISSEQGKSLSDMSGKQASDANKAYKSGREHGWRRRDEETINEIGARTVRAGGEVAKKARATTGNFPDDYRKQKQADRVEKKLGDRSARTGAVELGPGTAKKLFKQGKQKIVKRSSSLGGRLRALAGKAAAKGAAAGAKAAAAKGAKAAAAKGAAKLAGKFNPYG